MAERAVEAILFDLGQTLLEFGKLHTNKLFAVSAKASYAWLKAQSQPVPFFLRYRLKHLLGLYLHLVRSAVTGNDFDSLELLKLYGKRYGFTLSDQQYKELNWIWYEPLSKEAFTEPGLIGTLRTLRSMGLKLGIVSNTFVNKDSLQRHLAQTGILEFFPVQLYTCDFTYRKPDPRIFLDAAKQIAVEPARILFVGDRVDTDVNGAIAAGMIPVLKKIPSRKYRTIPKEAKIITKISDLPALVRQLITT